MRLQRFRHAKGGPMTAGSSPHHLLCMAQGCLPSGQRRPASPHRREGPQTRYLTSLLIWSGRPPSYQPLPVQSGPPLSLPPYQAGVKHHPCRHRRSCKHTCSRRAAHHLALLASCCCICLVHDCIAALCSAVDSPPGLVTAKPIFRCSVSKSLIRLFIWDHFFLSDAAGSLAMSCDRRRLKTVSRCPFSPSLSLCLSPPTPSSHLLRLLLL